MVTTVSPENVVAFGKTAGHLSPEALAAKRQGQRGTVVIDLSKQAPFDCGVCIAELMTGVHPIRGYGEEGVGETYDAARLTLPSDVELSSAGYPELFIELLHRMLSCDAARRPDITKCAGVMRRILTSSGLVSEAWYC